MLEFPGHLRRQPSVSCGSYAAFRGLMQRGRDRPSYTCGRDFFTLDSGFDPNLIIDKELRYIILNS